MSADHYFTADPQAPDRPREVTVSAAGRRYVLVASSGVFSAGRLDPGTAVLLRKAPLPGPRGGVFLDLGCGYGALTVPLAASSPDAVVYAVDVNARALELAAHNAAKHGLADRVRAVPPDQVPADVLFDEIWSNPPIRIGKAALHAMLARWLARLGPDGLAWLVVARHLGADSLAQWLVDQGWSVRRHAAQKGYRVLSVGRPEPQTPDTVVSPAAKPG